MQGNCWSSGCCVCNWCTSEFQSTSVIFFISSFACLESCGEQNNKLHLFLFAKAQLTFADVMLGCVTHTLSDWECLLKKRKLSCLYWQIWCCFRIVSVQNGKIASWRSRRNGVHNERPLLSYFSHVNWTCGNDLNVVLITYYYANVYFPSYSLTGTVTTTILSVTHINKNHFYTQQTLLLRHYLLMFLVNVTCSLGFHAYC